MTLQIKTKKLTKSTGKKNGKTRAVKGGPIILTPPSYKPNNEKILAEENMDVDPLAETTVKSEDFRISNCAFLLTYNKKEEPHFNEEDLMQLKEELRRHDPSTLTGCLELNEHGIEHMHVMFSGKAVTDRLLKVFKYKGILPNCVPNRARGKAAVASIMRGHYYAGICPKIGRVCWYSDLVDRNQFDMYQANWVMSLVRKGKVTPENGRDELWKWRNNDSYQLKKCDMLIEKQAQDRAVVRNKTIRAKADAKMKPWRSIHIVDEWRKVFVEPEDHRYDFLIVIGPTKSGKSKYAESLFKNAFNHRAVENWNGYSSGIHDAVIFHDVENIFQKVLINREMFQSNGIQTVGSSKTNCFAREIDLYGIPIVIVTNRDNCGITFENEWIKGNSVKYTVGPNEVLWEKDASKCPLVIEKVEIDPNGYQCGNIAGDFIKGICIEESKEPLVKIEEDEEDHEHPIEENTAWEDEDLLMMDL